MIKRKRSEFLDKNKYYLVAFFLPMVLYCMLCFQKGIFPFGGTSNLVYDLNIQYEELFSYFREVLLGNAKLSYSFSKSIGGSLISLWGFYLGSPLNLLVVFFPKEQMQLFVFVITALKIGLCGMTFAIFIKNKFNKLCIWQTTILCIGYCFTQYMIGQMSNLHWLDGVYLLPLILFAVDKFIDENKKILLYLLLVMTIVFNWYTGYINCIFVVLYYLYSSLSKEYLINGKVNIVETVKKTLTFLAIELLSVFGSLFVFLPVVLAQSGGRSAFDKGIFEFGTNGSLLDVLRGFMIGSPNPSKEITLFCSVFALIWFVYFWVDDKILKFEKIITGIFLSFMVSSLFFMPLEHVWVGFKFENSFAYRFLYTAIIVVLLICGRVLEHFEELEKKKLFRVILGIILTFLVLDLVKSFDAKRLWIEIFLLITYALLYKLRESKKNSIQFIVRGIFCLIFLSEILLNAKIVMGNIYQEEAQEYVEYVKNEKLLIDQIRPSSDDFYRIEKTLSREMDENHNSFMANESFVYLYGGIQQYTSAYDAITGDLLMNLGYSRYQFPNIYHGPILAADSLLGERYLLSEEVFDGYTLQKQYTSYNKKAVYKNEYALPIGFTTKDNILSISSNKNPFEYINDIYSGILGENIQLMKKAMDVSCKSESNNLKYTIDSLEKNDILYAKINGDYLNLEISINGKEKEKYTTGWSNRNVILLGNLEKESELIIYNCDKADVEFYTLNLDVLKEVSNKIKRQKVTDLEIKDDFVKFTASGEKAMLTIPYDTSWQVKVNGKKVKPQKGAEAFMVIPLEDAEKSHVTMEYAVRGKKVGLVLSLSSVFIFAFWMLIERRNGNVGQ